MTKNETKVENILIDAMDHEIKKLKIQQSKESIVFRCLNEEKRTLILTKSNLTYVQEYRLDTIDYDIEQKLKFLNTLESRIKKIIEKRDERINKLDVIVIRESI